MVKVRRFECAYLRAPEAEDPELDRDVILRIFRCFSDEPEIILGRDVFFFAQFLLW